MFPATLVARFVALTLAFAVAQGIRDIFQARPDRSSMPFISKVQ